MTGTDHDIAAILAGMFGQDAVWSGERLVSLDPGFHADNLAAGVLVSPGSTAEVATLVEFCRDRGVSIVPQGGRTGLAGAAASRQGQVLLSTQRLNRIESIDAQSGVAIVGAGVRLAELDDAARTHGLSAGIDLAARDSATLGGMASTNAGGMEAFRNGIMRHRILGLEAVMADGTVLSDLKLVRKANEGYDIKQLLIGAEGTLGIITKLSLLLEPLRAQDRTWLLACADASAAQSVVSDVRSAPRLSLLRAEAMWPDYYAVTARQLQLDRLAGFGPAGLYLILETEGEDEEGLEDLLGRAIGDGRLSDALLAKNDSERRDMWLVREDSWAVMRQYAHGVSYDISVPGGQLDTYMRGLEGRISRIDPDLRMFAISHLVDGNVHLYIAADRPFPESAAEVSRAVFDGLVAMGGSMSAEHGIGIEKMSALEEHGDRGRRVLATRIKQALDPQNIMNPGKVYPPERIF